MSAAKLLDRLSKVRQTAPDKWIARCPAHEDKSPSLSVRELSDGRTLIHCFAGCGGADVVSAVGLEFGDLFPPRPEGECPARGTLKPRIPARDLLLLIAHESTVVAVIASDLSAGQRVGDETYQRLATACSRILEAKLHA